MRIALGHGATASSSDRSGAGKRHGTATEQVGWDRVIAKIRTLVTSEDEDDGCPLNSRPATSLTPEDLSLLLAYPMCVAIGPSVRMTPTGECREPQLRYLTRRRHISVLSATWSTPGGG